MDVVPAGGLRASRRLGTAEVIQHLFGQDERPDPLVDLGDESGL